MSFAPGRTVVAILSFEGPDVYSQAGGLGVRVKELARALAQLGYEAHLFFVGDPDLPAEETHEGGLLHYHRWGQWISRSHPNGVYDGEDAKIYDWNHSLPGLLVDRVIGPAAAGGKAVLVMGEEWHTAWTMNLVSDSLYYRGLRDRAVLLWNANNIFSFHRINWGALGYAATITTVSRYMKHYMWGEGVNPIVIPNGIPRAAITDAPADDLKAVREAAEADLFLFKIGRFDPDKRWIMAMAAAAELKRQGVRPRLLIRGGREPHGGEVLAYAASLGLTVRHAGSPRDAGDLVRVLRAHPDADVINLNSFLPEAILGTIYAAADAVLANSGHEPFGLVGLEVMAAGGLAVTGSTGEDYADPYRNAVVLETDDSMELVTSMRMVRERPDIAAKMRLEGRRTARDYTWDKVIDQLFNRAEFAAAKQGVKLPAADRPRPGGLRAGAAKRARAGKPRTQSKRAS